jgi:hypothetical protein
MSDSSFMYTRPDCNTYWKHTIFCMPIPTESITYSACQYLLKAYHILHANTYWKHTIFCMPIPTESIPYSACLFWYHIPYTHYQTFMGSGQVKLSQVKAKAKFTYNFRYQSSKMALGIVSDLRPSPCPPCDSCPGHRCACPWTPPGCGGWSAEDSSPRPPFGPSPQPTQYPQYPHTQG